MAWHLVEKMIEESATHSTLLGKWWIGVMFIFRIIVVASIGDNVYTDEQEEFICNTMQPGCKQVCYNRFAPISHIRFWAFQILATGTPSVVFIIFAMHKLVTVPSKPSGNEAHREVGTQTSWKHASSQSSGYRSETEKHDDRKSDSKYSRSSNESKKSSKKKLEVIREYEIDDIIEMTSEPSHDKISRQRKVKRVKTFIIIAYIIQVLFRTGFEALFLFLQILLYSWKVPETYECIEYPCPKIVECYVSRPKEKTFFLWFMFGVACACLALNVSELKYLAWRRLKRSCSGSRTASYNSSALVVSANGKPVQNLKRSSRSELHQPLGRVISREAVSAPPGYYIPDVDPPSEKYRCPANGFPHIRLRAASFTTSESDVTTDDDQDSMDSGMHYEHSRAYL